MDAWIHRPSVLVYPAENLLQISPFTRGQTAEERLNAFTRLTVLIGVFVILLMVHQREKNVILGVTIFIALILHRAMEYTTQQFSHAQRKMSDPSTTPNMPLAHAASTNEMSIQPLAAQPKPQPNPQVRTGGTSAYGSPPAHMDPSVVSAADLITAQQQLFSRTNRPLQHQPTRFDVQNAALPIGGSAPVRRTMVRTHADHSPVHPNPGPFDFGTAVHSTNPKAYTYQENPIERMMRAPDEVDPDLVTNPIPDPTFMARMPTFDKSYEYEGVDRWRLQNHAGFRFY